MRRRHPTEKSPSNAAGARTIRKFRTDLAPLTRFAQGVFPPFEEKGAEAFIEGFRAASRNVRALVCVVSDSPMEIGPLESIKMRNLREEVLGPSFRPGSLRVEREANHFELDQRERVDRHLADLFAMLASGPQGATAPDAGVLRPAPGEADAQGAPADARKPADRA